MAQLTDYELEREERIKQNKARMAAMGLDVAAEALQALIPKPKPRKPRAERKEKVRQAPTRQSSRLQGEAAIVEASELALFVINDECPRCGKVLVRTHKSHLEKCTGKGRKRRRELSDLDGNEDADVADDEDDEDVAALAASKEAERVMRMDAKMKELQLSGLASYDPATCATFNVKGSKGNNYLVELCDGKQTCTCIDHRIRRHNCKHIRLVLTLLDIPDAPEDWRKAVEAKLKDALAGSQEDSSAEAVEDDNDKSDWLDQPLASRRAARAGGAARPRKIPKSRQQAAGKAAWPPRRSKKGSGKGSDDKQGPAGEGAVGQDQESTQLAAAPAWPPRRKTRASPNADNEMAMKFV